MNIHFNIDISTEYFLLSSCRCDNFCMVTKSVEVFHLPDLLMVHNIGAEQTGISDTIVIDGVRVILRKYGT